MNGIDTMLISSDVRPIAVQEDIGEAKTYQAKLGALLEYARKSGMSRKKLNHIAKEKVWSEWNAGQLLAEIPRERGFAHSSHDGTNAAPYQKTLAEACIKRMTANRWQTMALVPESDLLAYFAKQISSEKDITSRDVFYLGKKLRPAKMIAQIPGETCSVRDLDALISDGFSFSTIYADPPWLYGNQGTRAATGNHYGGMTVAEIAALPIQALASENAHLHLWTTNAFISDALAIMEAWGFEYKSCFIWVKPQMGIGNYWRVSHEFMLFGIRGKCPFLDHGQMSWLKANRGSHSSKPDQIRKIIESTSPAPRIELFGRQVYEGWTVWGDQISRDLLYSTAKEVA